ncbi:hypothetical protein LN449_09780 [Xanthomonas cannabis]|uniref:hypothetical protein n=1 Tax=Xanthomonas cannabis TaxID=1885674 RepID=UPI001E3D54D6|nr:hypothetical protein [Xanthomonas cannabis]MCC8442804.1 hypothetical protein [Xanthomonas cannabis]
MTCVNLLTAGELEAKVWPEKVSFRLVFCWFSKESKAMLGAPGQKFGAKAGRRARVTQVQDGCAVALALLRIRLIAASGF